MKNDKALVDIAYDVLKEKISSGEVDSLSFSSLCQEVCSISEISEKDFLSRASRFYTDITLDGRFVFKNNNAWSLKEFEKYSDVDIDMNDVYSVEEEANAEEESEEELDTLEDDEEIMSEDDFENEDEEKLEKKALDEDILEDE